MNRHATVLNRHRAGMGKKCPSTKHELVEVVRQLLKEFDKSLASCKIQTYRTCRNWQSKIRLLTDALSRLSRQQRLLNALDRRKSILSILSRSLKSN